MNTYQYVLCKPVIKQMCMEMELEWSYSSIFSPPGNTVGGYITVLGGYHSELYEDKKTNKKSINK